MTTASRKARRNLAKKMGFLGKKQDVSDWKKRISRSIEMGKKIHVQTIERQVNMEIEKGRIQKITTASNETSSLDQGLYQIPNISSVPYQIDETNMDNGSDGPTSSSI